IGTVYEAPPIQLPGRNRIRHVWQFPPDVVPIEAGRGTLPHLASADLGPGDAGDPGVWMSTEGSARVRVIRQQDVMVIGLVLAAVVAGGVLCSGQVRSRRVLLATVVIATGVLLIW